MSELFVELFSEEIPAKLQINARNELKKILKIFLLITKLNLMKISMFIQHQID